MNDGPVCNQCLDQPQPIETNTFSFRLKIIRSSFLARFFVTDMKIFLCFQYFKNPLPIKNKMGYNKNITDLQEKS